MKLIIRVMLTGSLFTSILSACSPGPAPQATPEIVRVEITATPRPTNTPVVITNTPKPPEPTKTRRPTPNTTATYQALQDALYEAQWTAVQPDLEKYGVADNGYLAWFELLPLKMEVDTYQESTYITLPVENMKDFVLQSEVEWDSSSGLAGCGFLFRADEDIEEGEQYQLALMRLQYQPGWDIEYFNYGQWQYTLTDSRVQFTNRIHDEPGSVNKLTLVANGEQLTVYINGERIRSVTDNKLKEGLIGMFTWQESGESYCVFSNTWIWVLNEEPPPQGPGSGVG